MKLTVAMVLLALQAEGHLAPVTVQPTCRVPVVPDVVRPVKPVRPAVPSCVDESRNRHTCRNAVINEYNQSMSRYGESFDLYVLQINDYIVSLNRYIEDASRYAACERDAAGARSGYLSS